MGSEAPAVTLGRMRAMSPSLGASSVTILVAVLGISTASVKADFLDRNFLDNLFSFSRSQSADYPSYDDVQQYSQYDAVEKQEDADTEEIKKSVKDIGGGKHVKGGVLPAYCDPPNPCPKGYTAEDGCIEVEEFGTGQSSAGNTRLHRTACVTRNTCFLVRMSTHTTRCTKTSRTQVSLDWIL